MKTDAVDACTLAELLAADLVPRVWVGDEWTRLLRRLVSRRRQLVKQATRTKNEIHAVLLRNLKGRPPVSDVFGKRRAGVAGDAASCGSTSGRRSRPVCGRLEFVRAEVARVDQTIAEQALASAEIRRLMTIPGLDATTAAALMAAIGDISRFPTPRQLVGYLGLDPRRAPVGPQPGHARAGSPRRARPPPARARRVGLGRHSRTGTATRLRRAHRRPPRSPHRRRRGRAQARRARLAHAQPRRGLRLPAPLPRQTEAAASSNSRPARPRAKRTAGATPIWGTPRRTTSSASSPAKPGSPTAGSSPGLAAHATQERCGRDTRARNQWAVKRPSSAAGDSPTSCALARRHPHQREVFQGGSRSSSGLDFHPYDRVEVVPAAAVEREP